MTLATTNNRKDYTADGAQTIFPYDFLLLDQTHLEVYLNGVLKVLTTDYTVSGVGVATGGNVTFITAPANLVKVLILRVVPLSQVTDYTEGSKFPAETHEAALDKLTMLTQQLAEVDKRSIKLPKTSAKTEIDIPEPVSGSELIRWKSDKTALELVKSSDLAAGTLSPITTKGDLLQGGDTNNPERLAVGAAGDVLTVASGKAAWQAPGSTGKLTNKSAATVNANDVVVLDSANDKAFTTTTTAGDHRPVSVVTETILANAEGSVAQVGRRVVAVTGAVTRGNYLRTSATVKRAEDTGVAMAAGVPTPRGAFAVAMQAAAGPGAGTVEAWLLGATETPDPQANYREWAEIADPATPAADKLRTFAKDDGGNTRFGVKDSAARVLMMLGSKGFREIEMIRKSADETVNNSATFQDDDHFQFTGLANVRYFFVFFLYFDGPTAADIKFRMNGAGISSFRVAGLGPALATAAVDADARSEESTTEVSFGTLAASTATSFAILAAEVAGSAGGGLVALQWAQKVATVGDTIVRADARMLIFHDAT